MDVIGKYQYLHRLMGYYDQNGVPILYGPAGAMPCLTPCSLMTVPKIIEALIAAEQGCKHFLLCNWSQGNIAQDLASIITYDKLIREYLDRFGYQGVETVSFSVNPTGRYPTEVPKVYGMISYFALIGILGKVDLIGSRTIDEAKHVPTMEGNAASHQCTKTMVNMVKDQKIDIINSRAVKDEAKVRNWR